MKSLWDSLLTPTVPNPARLTVEAQLLVLYDAPCRNRTYNLMIKSQLRASDLARTEGVYLGFQATNDAELVPPAHPKSARQFHGSIPELGGAA